MQTYQATITTLQLNLLIKKNHFLLIPTRFALHVERVAQYCLAKINWRIHRVCQCCIPLEERVHIIYKQKSIFKRRIAMDG